MSESHGSTLHPTYGSVIPNTELQAPEVQNGAVMFNLFCIPGRHSVMVDDAAGLELPEGWAMVSASVIPDPDPSLPGVWFYDEASPAKILVCAEHAGLVSSEQPPGERDWMVLSTEVVEDVRGAVMAVRLTFFHIYDVAGGYAYRPPL